MYVPIPEDAPDPHRPGWVPPAATNYPYQQPRPLYHGHTIPPAVYLPPYPAPYPGAYSPSYPLPQRRCEEAVVSLACGIAGWFLMPVICPILAIVFGIRAKRAIRQSHGTLTGGGMANVGLILGIAHFVFIAVGLLIALVVLALVYGIFGGFAH